MYMYTTTTYLAGFPDELFDCTTLDLAAFWLADAFAFDWGPFIFKEPIPPMDGGGPCLTRLPSTPRAGLLAPWLFILFTSWPGAAAAAEAILQSQENR